ncbi:MAG: hypothetical protein FIA91_02685 [Geobacter sp.]|nr:hypothetical protein [Geobacter sp.]
MTGQNAPGRSGAAPLGGEIKTKTMKLSKNIFTSVLWVLLSMHTSAFAEDNIILKYNDVALVRLVPSLEGCNFKSPCIELIQNDTILDYPPRRFELFGYFETISAPVKDSNLVLAKSTVEDNWLIYDLKLQRMVVKTSDFSLASNKWLSLTKTIPIFINATEAESRLEKSGKGSLLDSYETLHFLWVFSPFILIICLPVILFFMLFVYLITKKRKVTPQ